MATCRTSLKGKRVSMFLLHGMGIKVFSHMWRYAKIAIDFGE